MSFISTKEQTQKNLTDGDISELRASRFFIVNYSAITDPVIAVNASGIPDYFSAHPDDSQYLVKSKRAVATGEEGGSFWWIIQVDYSNRIILPLSEPDKISWDFTEATEQYFFDLASSPVPVVNSAGQPFESLPEREGGQISATVTRNVATTYDVSVALSYRQKTNSDGITVDGVSISAGQAKMSGISISEPQYSNGEYYRVLKFNLKFRDTWNDKIADMGYYELVSGDLKPINDALGQAVQKPWPLNGSGGKQSTATTAPATLTFKPYAQAAFSSFGFT